MKKKTVKIRSTKEAAPKAKNKRFDFFLGLKNTVLYYSTKWDKKEAKSRVKFSVLSVLLVAVCALFLGFLAGLNIHEKPQVLSESVQVDEYWFLLHRKSNVEMLYKGVPGDANQSALIRTFQVKTGVSGKKPTPLPQRFGRSYWTITKKYETSDNPETAPYFIELDIPHSEEESYGPAPYLECDGQCNWELPGPFGLHGVNGDTSRLGQDNAGSSGCVRHTDSDIAFLYELIKPEDATRYYIEDK